MSWFRVSGFRFRSKQISLAPLRKGCEGYAFFKAWRRMKEDTKLKKADFRTFYRDAHAVECLTDREKMLIGLTVAMMRLCDP